MKTSILFGFLLTLFISTAGAALEPSQIREALPKKTSSYLKQGLISGVDREVNAAIVKNVRPATNGTFERIVVDIDSEKAPYYQAAIDPTLRRILVTIFGSPKLAIDAKKIVEQFRKSPLVSRIEFFPLVEDDAWTFALYLRAAVPVEVFELSAPTRIIFDLKGGAALINELASKAKPPRRAIKRAPVHATPATRLKPARKKATVIRANPDEDEYEGNGASSRSDDIPE
jgi:hypothetical protein